MTNIRFDKDFPKENQSSVHEFLRLHEQLIPDWCDRLTVYFEPFDKNKGFSLETVVSYPYRFAQLYVYASWFTSRDQEREIVHELFHIITGPATTAAYENLELLLKNADPTLRTSMLENYRHVAESTVEDLTILYLSGRLAL